MYNILRLCWWTIESTWSQKLLICQCILNRWATGKLAMGQMFHVFQTEVYLTLAVFDYWLLPPPQYWLLRKFSCKTNNSLPEASCLSALQFYYGCYTRCGVASRVQSFRKSHIEINQSHYCMTAILNKMKLALCLKSVFKANNQKM